MSELEEEQVHSQEPEEGQFKGLEALLLRQRYEVQQTLGQSDLATTYLAVDHQTQQKCVVKCISLKRAETIKSVELFEREAKILANLEHPQIPKFIDAFTVESDDDRQYYLVQEYITGKNLTQLVTGGKHFSEKEVLQLAIGVTNILDYIHGLSPPIIHRDIKPSNIIVTPEGKPYLVDFGVVQDVMRPTGGETSVAGTYGYMPFEQFEGTAVPASDIYSLGVTLIYVLSHLDPLKIERDKMRLDFRPYVNVSPRLAAIMERMIAYDWTGRYRSALLLRDDLQNLAAGKRQKFAFGPLRMIAAACALLVFLGTVAITTRPYWTPPVAQTESQQVSQTDPAPFRAALPADALANPAGVTQLNLGNKGLTELPPEIGKFVNLEELNLHYNKLTRLPPEIGQLKHLQKLYLYSNQLYELPPEIGKLEQLTDLTLNYNKLTQLPPEFGKLMHLQRLDLYNNPLTALPQGLESLKSMQELNLSGTRITELPAGLWKMTNLQRLYLGQTLVSRIPPEVQQLSGLQILALEGARVREIPPEIGKLVGLQSLLLSDNLYKQIPESLWNLTALQNLSLDVTPATDSTLKVANLENLQNLKITNKGSARLAPQMVKEIGKLRRLQVLNLSSNQLDELPAEIWQMTELQRLYIAANHLSELPPAIGNLTELRELSLYGNQLKGLPKEIGKLSSLQELNLNENRIAELPVELAKLPKLQQLYLSSNRLTRLPPGLTRMEELQRLELSNNRLTELGPEIGQMTELRYLGLGGNRLTRLPPEIGKLTELTELNLYGNRIKALPPEIGNLTNLTSLVLNDTQITELPMPLMEKLKGLRYLTLPKDLKNYLQTVRALQKLLPACNIR